MFSSPWAKPSATPRKASVLGCIPPPTNSLPHSPTFSVKTQPNLHIPQTLLPPTSRHCPSRRPLTISRPHRLLHKEWVLQSARDCLKQEASRLQYFYLLAITRPDLQKDLSKILIASPSYPIIGMCRSNPQNWCAPDLFIINLKMKLHLELYDPTLFPKCRCDKSINVFGVHMFLLCLSLQKVAHDPMVFATAPFIRDILLTTSIITKELVMYIYPKNILANLPGLRPFDSFFLPITSLKRITIPPICSPKSVLITQSCPPMATSLLQKVIQHQ